MRRKQTRRLRRGETRGRHGRGRQARKGSRDCAARARAPPWRECGCRACRRRAAFTIPRSTRIPAASASLPTSRAARSHKTHRGRARDPAAISSIAARSAPIRAPATAPASWCKSRTSSSPRRQSGSASALPKPGEYAVGALFMPRDPDWRQVIRDIYAQMIKREGMRSWAGARCRPTTRRSASW